MTRLGCARTDRSICDKDLSSRQHRLKSRDCRAILLLRDISSRAFDRSVTVYEERCEPDKSKYRRVLLLLSIKLWHQLYDVSSSSSSSLSTTLLSSVVVVVVVVKFRPDSLKDLRLVLVESPSCSAAKIEASKDRDEEDGNDDGDGDDDDS